MPSTDNHPPRRGDAVTPPGGRPPEPPDGFAGTVRRTTTRYSSKIPWLPLIIAAVVVPLLLTALATLTGIGDRDPIESDLTDRSRQALAAAGISGASVDFEGRDGTVEGVPEGQEDVAEEALDGVDGVRVADVSTVADDGADTEEPPTDEQQPPVDKKALQADITAALKASRIEFDTGATDLTAGSEKTLAKVAKLLVDAPDVQIRVEGHTTGRKDNAHARKVSERRAETVKARLAELGVAEDRITVEGFGASKPIASRDTREGQAANRRVDIKVL